MNFHLKLTNCVVLHSPKCNVLSICLILYKRNYLKILFTVHFTVPASAESTLSIKIR